MSLGIVVEHFGQHRSPNRGKNFEKKKKKLSDSGSIWAFILGSLPDTWPVDVQGEFDWLMFGTNLEPESVILLDDGLFSLPEQSFSILSIAEDGGSTWHLYQALNQEKCTVEQH